MIVQSIGKDGKATISFTVSKTDVREALNIAEKVCREIGCTEVLADERIAKVSIVGVGMRSHSGVAARMFQALANNDINIQMISTSEIKLSCVVDENDIERAIKAIHDEFELLYIFR
jgi:aspartate kinase